MSQIFKILILTCLLIIPAAGICSDSAYISIRWYGEADKPYHEFVFYKKDGYNPEPQGPFLSSPFVLQCALTENEFKKLKDILFSDDRLTKTIAESKPLYGNYYMEYFEGSNALLSKLLSTRTDYIRAYKLTTIFFKGTEYESAIKNRWAALFARIGIDPE